MENKKDIEQIFQEKFGDFEANPPQESWDFISEKINEKEEKRRIIPLFWLKSAIVSTSVAAVLLISYFLFNDKIDSNLPKNNTEIAHQSPEIQNQKITENNLHNHSKIDAKTAEIINHQNNITDSKNTNFSVNTITAESSLPKSNTSKNIKLTNNTLNSVEKNKTNLENPSSEEKNLAKNLQPEITPNQQNKEEKSPIVLAENNLENSAKKEQEVLKKEENILAQNNSEEDIFKTKLEKETQKETQKKSKKLSVFANYTPLFASSTKGSAISNSFDNNTKTFDDNNSFGAGIQYAINDKISVRTGVNNYSLNHKTQNVIFFKAKTTPSNNYNNDYKTLSLNENGKNMVILNNNASFYNADVVGSVNSGTLNQEMSFIEIPIEFSYNLLNKKLKINTITGFSSVILNKNAVSVSSNNTKTEIGKSNNINDVHFTGNVGLGFSYPFSKNLDLKLEPTFKYHFNTFKDKQNSFSPYFIGVYTGFVYKF